MLRAEEYRIETLEIHGVPLNVTSYRIGERYHCHVENVDPGATIARAEASSRTEAQKLALAKTRERLKDNDE